MRRRLDTSILTDNSEMTQDGCFGRARCPRRTEHCCRRGSSQLLIVEAHPVRLAVSRQVDEVSTARVLEQLGPFALWRPQRRRVCTSRQREGLRFQDIYILSRDSVFLRNPKDLLPSLRRRDDVSWLAEVHQVVEFKFRVTWVSPKVYTTGSDNAKVHA